MIAFNIIILNIAGNVGVAAYGITANIALVIIAIFTGMGQGMQPIISINYNNRSNINKIYKYAFILSLFISSAFILSLLYLLTELLLFLIGIISEELSENICLRTSYIFSSVYICQV